MTSKKTSASTTRRRVARSALVVVAATGLGVISSASAATTPAHHRAGRHLRVRIARLSNPQLRRASSQSSGGIAVAPSVFVALQDARLSGQPVLVKSLFSKTTSVAANPDGTLSETVAAGPVQEPDASSATGFSPINLNLVDVPTPGTESSRRFRMRR